MTPINRIPIINSDKGVTLVDTVRSEMPTPPLMLSDQLDELTTHDDSEAGLTVTLDWAMQLRTEFGIDWSTAISVAMTLYYG